jgi:hypothetical protein
MNQIITDLQFNEFKQKISNLSRNELESTYLELIVYYHKFKQVSYRVFNVEDDCLASEANVFTSKDRIVTLTNQELMYQLKSMFIKLKRVNREVTELMKHFVY